MTCLAGVPPAGRGLDVLAMMCLAGVPSAGRGLDVLAMMCLAGVPSAMMYQSAPSNTVT